MDIKHIYITGFMGSGKTRIGKFLAKKLNQKFIDTDDLIEQRVHKSVKQIFDSEGENWFRLKEKEILNEIVSLEENYIISLGGGALMEKENIKNVKQSGVLIYIQSNIEDLWNRTKSKTERPLLLDEGEIPNKTEYFQNIKNLLSQRMDGYKKADISINRDDMEAEDVVEVLIAKLKNYSKDTEKSS